MKIKRDELSILVVDDMKFNCEFIRHSLFASGYKNIRTANSATAALEQLRENPTDVVIADWVMPEMDGMELTARIRQLDEELAHYTYILLLTARDDIESITEAFDRGVDDYLTKPPNKQELAARVHAAGRISTMQNDLLDAIGTLRAEYERDSTVDPVTNLGNRRDYQRRFEETLRLVESRGGALCCGYLELNDASALRTQFGEKVYNQILLSVANRLRRTLRPTDIIARLNEGAFIIGLYYQDKSHVRSKTFKRVLQAINLRPFKTNTGFLSVTVAMSMSCHAGEAGERPKYSPEQFLAQAQALIEQSRKTGCTEVAY